MMTAGVLYVCICAYVGRQGGLQDDGDMNRARIQAAYFHLLHAQGE